MEEAVTFSYTAASVPIFDKGVSSEGVKVGGVNGIVGVGGVGDGDRVGRVNGVGGVGGVDEVDGVGQNSLFFFFFWRVCL